MCPGGAAALRDAGFAFSLPTWRGRLAAGLGYGARLAGASASGRLVLRSAAERSLPPPAGRWLLESAQAMPALSTPTLATRHPRDLRPRISVEHDHSDVSPDEPAGRL